MNAALSPHIRAALARIKSGWRMRYAVQRRCPWEVYETTGQVSFFYEQPAEARAEYLRLTARESKGEVA